MSEKRIITIESESIGKISFEITEENPLSAEKFLKILPLEACVNLWGDEIYFKIPINRIEPENPRQIVKEGEVGIWIEEPSLCIFFGKTPISSDKEIKAYSDVNIIGKIIGDYKILKKVRNGEKIKVLIS